MPITQKTKKTMHKKPKRKYQLRPKVLNTGNTCWESYPCQHEVKFRDKKGKIRYERMYGVAIYRLYKKFKQVVPPHFQKYGNKKFANYPNKFF